MFDDKYMQLNKDGTFGWTRLTYVAELKQKKKAGPSFGLMAPGRFWIDDVSLERVGPEVPLTPAPILGKEESPISPPRRDRRVGPALQRVRLPQPGRREDPATRAAKRSKPNGTSPPAQVPRRLPRSRTRTRSAAARSSESTRPRAQRRCGSTSRTWSWTSPQNWLGYDYPQGRFVYRRQGTAAAVRGDSRPFARATIGRA